MMRSLFSGVSGLRNHQVEMDVIGNNIANVNTLGFKASRVTFEEAFAQLVQGARPPGSYTNVSGLNPTQVGLGMNIGSIDLLFTQGNLEATGVNTDLAIQGDSFFVVSDGVQNFYTRAGNFVLDANGRLVASTNGFVVQGRMATDGVLTDADHRHQHPLRTEVRGQGHTDRHNHREPGRWKPKWVRFATPASPSSTRRASAHEMTISFEKSFHDDVGLQRSRPRTAPRSRAGHGTLTFDNEGRLAAPVPTDPFVFTPDGGAADVSIAINWGEEGEMGGLSQFAAPSTAVLREQDGNTMGNLQGFSIDQDGTISGAFSNGVTQTLGQIALADFNNPAGMVRVGDNMYQVSANSGSPSLASPGREASPPSRPAHWRCPTSTWPRSSPR